MIKILISSPQGTGKTAIAKMFLKALRHAGFVNVELYTTNTDFPVPDGVTREKED